MSDQQSYNDMPGLESIVTPQKAGLRSMPRKGDKLFLDMYITQKMKNRMRKEWETLERQTRGLRLRTARNAATVRKQAEELIKSGEDLLGMALAPLSGALGEVEGPKSQKAEPRTAPHRSGARAGAGVEEEQQAKKQGPSEIFAKSQPFAKKKAGFKSMVWGKDPAQQKSAPEVVIEPKVQKREPKEFKSLGVEY
ncbi:hypothetical protein L6258_02960 [Candidatus Parcubacteria bacterium]|nr:hypothetical protein [Candidatus Parcubacteria bacterium]